MQGWTQRHNTEIELDKVWSKCIIKWYISFHNGLLEEINFLLLHILCFYFSGVYIKIKRVFDSLFKWGYLYQYQLSALGRRKQVILLSGEKGEIFLSFYQLPHHAEASCFSFHQTSLHGCCFPFKKQSPQHSSWR